MTGQPVVPCDADELTLVAAGDGWSELTNTYSILSCRGAAVWPDTRRPGAG
jgi:hypothetical protein